jgi:hypothetical protein
MPSSCCEHGDMCLCIDAKYQNDLRKYSENDIRKARAIYNAARIAFQADRRSAILRDKLKRAWSNLHSAMVFDWLFAAPPIDAPNPEQRMISFT